MAVLAAFRSASARRSLPLLPHLFRSSTILHRPISTLVLGEHEGGVIKQSSLCAVEAAKTISEENNISLLLAGSGPNLLKAASQAASSHPSISQVLVADADLLMHPLAETRAALVHFVQQKGHYSHIISSSTSCGKNILPRAAALLNVSPITDVIKICEPRKFVRPIYAGNALCTVKYNGEDPCVITVRSTSFPLPIISSGHEQSTAAPISQVDMQIFSKETCGKSRWLSHTTENTARPDLGNARVVLTGGRGLKSTENFKLLEKLAEKLGAAVGATRAAVDAGFVSNDLQVGQTGKVVAPELYIAFGVSGAIQHIAGMRDSKIIVAINKDADAPIFQICIPSQNKLR